MVAAKKILIVEDDKDFLWILRQTFEAEGFNVVYALDGVEGISVAKKEAPDLILADILMPNMDGITMVKKMKEGGIAAKIIFLTNVTEPSQVSQAVDAVGGTDYIVKSDVHMDAIVERVKEKLGA